MRIPRRVSGNGLCGSRRRSISGLQLPRLRQPSCSTSTRLTPSWAWASLDTICASRFRTRSDHSSSRSPGRGLSSKFAVAGGVGDAAASVIDDDVRSYRLCGLLDIILYRLCPADFVLVRLTTLATVLPWAGAVNLCRRSLNTAGNGAKGRCMRSDYRYLACTMCCKFNPTDLLHLTPRAKRLTLLQSRITVATLTGVAGAATVHLAGGG